MAAPIVSKIFAADPAKLPKPNTTSPAIRSRPARRGDTPARIVAAPNRISPTRNLDQHDPGDERRTHHAEHHPHASQETALLGLGSLESHHGENERYVRGEHQGPSEHRTLFRIAPEVEQMAEQKQEARRCTGQPASRPDELR